MMGRQPERVFRKVRVSQGKGRGNRVHCDVLAVTSSSRGLDFLNPLAEGMKAQEQVIWCPSSV